MASSDGGRNRNKGRISGGRRLSLSSTSTDFRSRALIQLLQSQKQDFFVRYISDCSWKAV